MKRIKSIILLLSFFTLTLFSAVPASASGIQISNIPSDLESFLRTESYINTHPIETANMTRELAEGNIDVINQYFPNLQDQNYMERSENLIGTMTLVSKADYITRSPRNTERNEIPTARVKSSDPGASHGSRSTLPLKMTILAFDSDLTSNAVNIAPFLAYKNSDNELVIWGLLRNNSGQKIEIKAVPDIKIISNGKVLASGNADPFEKSMKMSPYQVKINLGIYDGLPDECFIKIVFEPGTYDDSVDISSLDNLQCSYTMDYSAIK